MLYLKECAVQIFLRAFKTYVLPVIEYSSSRLFGLPTT